LDLKQIKGIISLMESSNLTEFEIEEKDLKLRIRRGNENAPAVTASPTAPVVAVAPAAPASQEEAIVEETGVTIAKSPMVGTFYRAPSPDNPPFIEAGKKTAKGAVLCIIEAMKVMNEIKAECSGTIIEILVENGENVEYGQPLFKIKA
jgi:acetyl-CoA carboxylase biotin carboxyl carrier protein